MRRLACWARAVSWRSGGSADSPCSSNALVASSEATSPARAPPIPSATANIGGATKSASSLLSRWRPTSLAPAYSTIWSAIRLLLVAVLGVADSNHVRPLEALAARQLAAIEVGAVGGPHVLDVHVIAPLIDAGVVGGRELVLHLDLGPVRATERHAARQVEQGAGLIAKRRHHLQPRLGARPLRRRFAPPSRQRGVAVIRPVRVDHLGARQVALGAARHPKEEQVQHGQEAELERDGERLVHGPP